ncbi:Csu type fimbrial protein [Glaciimonas sp. GG7]
MVASVACYSGAFAGTSSATMTNTVNITNNCTVSANGINTSYDPVLVNATVSQSATGTVTYLCTIGSSPVVTLGQGTNPATGSVDAAPIRRLANGTTYLNYGLYQDLPHTINWGNTQATAPLPIVSLGVSTSINVYAQIPFGQEDKAGTYTDNVAVTLTF